MNVLLTNAMYYKKGLSFLPCSLAFFLLLPLLTGCHPRSCFLEPSLCYTPVRKQFEKMPSDFEDLSLEERRSDWGKEMRIGLLFAKEFDFYRAITSLKRALFLMPEKEKNRRIQAEYAILQCYFLAGKYREALEVFEFGTIRNATGAFPAFRDLLVMLYGSYLKTGQCEKSEAVLRLMEKGDPETASELKIFTALDAGDLAAAETLSENTPLKEAVLQFDIQYHESSKSVRKAQTLNALLPGAGYFYVGQKKSALTSFILNTSFLAATYYFFDHGNWGAAAFAASLEFGWYFGGINGAGLATKEYNECLYNNLGKELLIKKRLFPVLMLQSSF